MTLGRLLPAALAVFCATSATAQEGEPIAREAVDPANRMAIAVTAAVHNQVKELLGPEQSLALVIVAHQAAIAETCEGYEIDPERFTTVMNGIVADLRDLVEEGQNNLPVNIVMVGYGIALGGEAAVAAYDTEAFCAGAAGFYAQLEGDTEERFTVLKTGG